MNCCTLHAIAGWSTAACAGVNLNDEPWYGWTYADYRFSERLNNGAGSLQHHGDGFEFGTGVRYGNGTGDGFDISINNDGNGIGYGPLGTGDGGWGAGVFDIHPSFTNDD